MGGQLDKAIAISGVEALPERQRNNLALLKIANDNAYIPNVGWKKSDKVYWVYSEDIL